MLKYMLRKEQKYSLACKKKKKIDAVSQHRTQSKIQNTTQQKTRLTLKQAVSSYSVVSYLFLVVVFVCFSSEIRDREEPDLGVGGL